MSDSLITLDNLSIGYNNQPMLSGISFSIALSSFTAILGANGSGKSTLLKTLLGLQSPISGQIRFFTKGNIPLVFGYVPQAVSLDSLYPLTGFDVALMGSYGRIGPGCRVSRAERSFVKECLRVTTAEEFSGKPFSVLSGGQKQRVLIARALVTKPDVLVLDEPTAGVDAAATHALSEFISQIHQERQLTTLLVTHDLPLVRKHAEHVVWLHKGKALYGTAKQLLSPEHMAEIFETEIS
jgi:ABC-type Mn2+/Zn2+ transport system ATPase subunit